jgi:hypothetical protein
MSGRFDYVQYDNFAVEQSAKFKVAVEGLEKIINMEFPPAGPGHQDSVGRAKSLALTKLEECYMWIGKAIRDSQLGRAARRSHQQVNEGSQA